MSEPLFITSGTPTVNVLPASKYSYLT